METYLKNSEPDEISQREGAKCIKMWTAILINYKVSCPAIIFCMQFLNKRYINPCLDEDEVRSLVINRFKALRIKILKKERKFTFFRESNQSSLEEIENRIKLVNLPLYKNYKISKKCKKVQYWLQYATVNKILKETLDRFVFKNDYEVGVNFINLETASHIILDFINRFVLPLPKVIIKDNMYILENLQRKEIKDAVVFKEILINYAKKQELKELKTCKFCKSAPVPSEPELVKIVLTSKLYRTKKHKELEWWHEYCSNSCFLLERSLYKRNKKFKKKC